MTDLEVVREFYARVNRGDIEPALDLLDENSVMEVPPSLSAEPDVYRGREGALRYLHGFDGLVEEVRYEPLELLGESGGVIALVRVSGRGASSGIGIDLEVAVVHELEAGRIRQMHPLPDLESAREKLRRLGG